MLWTVKLFMPENFKTCYNHLTRLHVAKGSKVLYDTNKAKDFRLSFVLLKNYSCVEYKQRRLSVYLNNVTLFTRVPGLQVFNTVLIVKTILLLKMSKGILFKSRAINIRPQKLQWVQKQQSFFKSSYIKSHYLMALKYAKKKKRNFETSKIFYFCSLRTKD